MFEGEKNSKGWIRKLKMLEINIPYSFWRFSKQHLNFKNPRMNKHIFPVLRTNST